MTITFYRMTSEVRAVYKNMAQIVQLTGFLKEESSVIDPIVTVDGFDAYLGTVNYAYINEFGRYYFITGIESISTDLWRISFHVDVLYTYRNSIKENHGIVARNENQYDLLLNDGLFQTQQSPQIEQYSFPAGFSQQDFVIAIAGNS